MIIQRDNFAVMELDQDDEIEIDIFDCISSVYLTKEDVIKMYNHIKEQESLTYA